MSTLASVTPGTCLSFGQVTTPVSGSMVIPSAAAASGSAKANFAPFGASSCLSGVFGLSKFGVVVRSFCLLTPVTSS